MNIDIDQQIKKLKEKFKPYIENNQDPNWDEFTREEIILYLALCVVTGGDKNERN